MNKARPNPFILCGLITFRFFDCLIIFLYFICQTGLLTSDVRHMEKTKDQPSSSWKVKLSSLVALVILASIQGWFFVLVLIAVIVPFVFGIIKYGFWKTYFWTMVGLTIFSFSHYSKDGLKAIDIFQDIIWILMMITLFGYVFNKKLLSRLAWKVLAIPVIASFYLGTENFWNEDMPMEKKVSCISLAIIIITPLFISYYRYSFSPNNIFDKQSNINNV